MKNLIFLILIISTSYTKDLNSILNNMTVQQKAELARAYLVGEKHNLGLTLTAIAWQESQAGKWLINLDDPSFGLFHIKPTSKGWNRSREAEKLLTFEYSSRRVIEILNYWSAYHKGNWRKMIKSYNAGFNYNSPKAAEYLKNIQAKVMVLKLRLYKFSKGLCND